MCQRLFFNKVAGLKPAIFLKQGISQKVKTDDVFCKLGN